MKSRCRSICTGGSSTSRRCSKLRKRRRPAPNVRNNLCKGTPFCPSRHTSVSAFLEHFQSNALLIRLKTDERATMRGQDNRTTGLLVSGFWFLVCWFFLINQKLETSKPET